MTKIGKKHIGLYLAIGLATAHCGPTNSSGITGGNNLSNGNFNYTMGGGASAEEAGSGSYSDGYDGTTTSPASYGTNSYSSSPITDDGGAISIYVNPGKCEKEAESPSSVAALTNGSEYSSLQSEIDALMNLENSGVEALNKSISQQMVSLSGPAGSVLPEDDEPMIVVVANISRGTSNKVVANADGSFDNLDIMASPGDILMKGRISKDWINSQAFDGTTIFKAGDTDSDTCLVPSEGSDTEEFVNMKAFAGLDISDLDI